ncbi:trypsin-like peptidase domain-containing protein [Thalassotalea ponticola]|uniref:trypsin-like peptidase domain-containing protein n=1 Tax=Thalassotalea ponticola TaxID=1523392 RepID=UPI0025B424AB|nr:trypsin-like peptidase domain-containing protein [Thalassotalea ponticola]MDN3652843.1 trypsin-like peptidase domain-containing protein [Thalassotalea ponticola]
MRLIALLLCLLASSVSYGADKAQQIFHDLAPALFQIRLIDKATSEKSSIGSGFQINEQGYIATNYHVIAGFAQYPDKYIIEYENHLGEKGLLKLKTVDVINDLAIVLKQDNIVDTHFSLAQTPPSKGEKLYSLGNPHDLGMIVVPGTYNGLKKESFNQRIHFTGSVNPGMSGGPVVNEFAQVVGINVASSGNQIGFLIPVDKLQSLVSSFSQQVKQTFTQQIATQLHQYQRHLYSQLMDVAWQLKPFSSALIADTSVDFIRCWGDSNAQLVDELMFKAVTNCQMEEYIYLSDTFSTGTIDMEFHYFESKQLPSDRFYQIYQRYINDARASNNAGKEDVTEFSCHHDIVTNNSEQIRNKAIYCVRGYRKYEGLYDILYISASVDKQNKAIVGHYTLSGVDQQSAKAFNRKFMEAVTWN